MKPSSLCLFCAFAVLLWNLPAAPRPESKSDPASVVRSVMDSEALLREIPLREVILAATEKKVLRLEPDGTAADAAFLTHLREAADDVLTFLNSSDSPAKGLRRINEASRHVEDRLVKQLHRGDFTCAFPTTAAGDTQRSGYPDLRIVHKPSGRVYYLDPKLHEDTAANSTLRTFYYEPRELTGKIHDNACHLVLGIAHDGKDGAWRFTGWKLVDLFEFRVRLKAEFQASNKELYRRELIAGESTPKQD